MGSLTFKKQKQSVHFFYSYCKQINIDVNYALQFSEKKIENMQKLGKITNVLSTSVMFIQ